MEDLALTGTLVEMECDDKRIDGDEQERQPRFFS